MNVTGISIVMACLTLTGCSGSSGDKNNQNNSRFPVQLDQRVVSVSTDLDKDGSIDQVDRFEYDDMGRIIKKATEYANSRADQVTDYIYFDNDLIEIKRESESIKYLYENGRVVTRQVIEGTGDVFNNETNYFYNSNGLLIGTLGDPDLYDEFECSLVADTITVSEIGMTLNYEGSRLSSITSDDSVYSATFSYNTINQFTQLSETYDCTDDVETLMLNYDNAGLLVSSTDSDGFYINEDAYLYDSAGRIVNYVTTEYAGSNNFEERITQTFTYTNQGLLSAVESTTEDNDPGFFNIPSYISTYEYENESCVVAITANPLSTVLLDNLGVTYNVNNPLLCTYIIE